MSIRMQADDFYNAYLVLHDNNEALIERLQNDSGKAFVGNKQLGARITGSVEIVCLAFSVELYIKNLHFKLEGKAPGGHNILKLFDELPEKTQQDIYTYDAIANYGWNLGQFKHEICAISDGFVKWRYSHEVSSLRYNTYFALVFIKALISVSSDLK